MVILHSFNETSMNNQKFDRNVLNAVNHNLCKDIFISPFIHGESSFFLIYLFHTCNLNGVNIVMENLFRQTQP